MKAPLSVLVLAAGEGTRMKSSLPKVLHLLAGRSLLEHVLASVQGLHPKAVGIVVGIGKEQVRQRLHEGGWKRLELITQHRPRGSGHAVMQAAAWLRRHRGTLLIVYGDTPLLTTATLQALVDQHRSSGHAATFLGMELRDPSGYGRMIVGSDGLLERIMEDRDASEDERAVTFVNSGVACWEADALLDVLPQLQPNNVKKEYYLTDAVALLRQRQRPVGVARAPDPCETQGVNTRSELAQVGRLYRQRLLEQWMQAGVTVVDPETTYLDWNVALKPDTTLWPGTVIQGPSQIGAHCQIGPYTTIESSVVKDGACVGPFAHIRPGSLIEEGAHIGNFVEVKKSRIGKGSKANHLTYLGDARVGSRVNVGAGTITCNYDGFAKHQTVIADDVFIGSNSNLVAPIRLGRGALIAAGSTITEDVPADSLGIARSPQESKAGWAEAWRRRMRASPRAGHRHSRRKS
jgi:bifunctional UDP-N-acetylglucosamine pyrophosphorylase/glucosamine-1-phosphate N-acetyltransferase